MIFAVPVVRACGRRIAGGVYVECATTPLGMPIEHFIMDPPVPLPLDKSFSPQGVTIEQDEKGVHHIFDWVGSDSYPNVADMIEEVRRFGASRRAERIDYSLISEESRLILIHERAIIRSVGDVRPVLSGFVPYGPPYTCPKRRMGQWAEIEGIIPNPRDAAIAASHEPGGTMCAGMWYEDLEPSTVIDNNLAAGGIVKRVMPSFEYEGYARPPKKKVATWPGFIASLPIGRLVIVRDADEGKHVEKLKRAKSAKIRVDLVDQ